MPNRRGGPRDPADALFRAVADATRRRVVERLARGPATVSTLAQPLDMAMPTVLQHLRILQDAGIVTTRKDGRTRTAQLVPGALDPMADWIRDRRTPAERRIDRLAAHLGGAQTPPAADEPGADQAVVDRRPGE